MENRYLYKLILLLAVCSSYFSCNGYLEEMPQNKLKPTNTDDYEQLLNKAYISRSVLPYLEALTDDVFLDEANRIDRAANSADAYIGAYMWGNSIETTLANGDLAFERFYHSIYNTNVVIENIDNATGIVLDETAIETTRNNIKGEALALRAFSYFYLVNLYAPPYDPETCSTTPGIPINLETTADDKPYIRATLDKVYELIVNDLKDAIRLMEENPVEKSTKTKFTPIAAKALLARVYLYMQEWDLAIEQAGAVISENSALFDLREHGEDTLIYSDASLPWREMNFPGEGYLSADNSNVLFVTGINELMGIFDMNPYISSFSVDQKLFDSYDPGDVRKYYFIKNVASMGVVKLMCVKNRYYDVALDYDTWETILLPEYGYTRVIRIEEMYLILAEAYARKADGISEAVRHLNTLRQVKFREDDYTPLDPADYNRQSLLEKVWLERRLELCFEEHRWFDLRRTTRPPMVHIGLKEQVANLEKDDSRYVLQIPRKELSVNPEIGVNPR